MPSVALPTQGDTSWYDWASAVHDSITALESAPPPSGAGVGIPGVVQLSDFPGTTYDTKFANARANQQAQTHMPWIQFPPAAISMNPTAPYSVYSGMKLCGPGPEAPKNLELSNGKFSNHKVTVGANVTTNADSFFVGTTDVYDVVVANLAWQNNRTGQFWSQNTGTLYQCEFRSLSFYGWKHCFGSSTQSCRITGVQFTGNWAVNGHGNGDVQFHFGGSDNGFWHNGYLNIEGNVGNLDDGAGEFQMHFESVSKSMAGQGIYNTAANGFRGIRISGNGAGLVLHGIRLEGHNVDTMPSHGTLLKIDGGFNIVRDCWIGQGMANPNQEGDNDPGIIHVTGGYTVLDGLFYARANAAAASVPYIYQTGGTVRAYNAIPVDGAHWPSWGGTKPRADVNSANTNGFYDDSWTQI